MDNTFLEKKVRRNNMQKSIYIKRAQRIRSKLKNNNKSDRYRVSIYRSSKNISAQIIDDKNKKTIVSVSSLKDKIGKKKKTEISILMAEQLAKKAIEKKIKNVYFDRGRYKYHGRIKSFADSLRKNGLNF